MMAGDAATTRALELLEECLTDERGWTALELVELLEEVYVILGGTLPVDHA